MGNGKQRQFQTRGDSGFVENVRQMALHRLLADTELLGDITIAATLYDAANHFQFPGREAIGFALGNGSLLHELVQCAHQVDHALAADPVIPGGDGPYGGGKVVGQGVFEHDATGAYLQGFNDLLGGDGAGREQDLYSWRTTHDGPHSLETGQTRHLQIKEEDVGQQFEGCCDGFVAVRCLTQHFEAGVALKHVFDADTNDWMVVGDDDTNLVQAVVAGLRCG